MFPGLTRQNPKVNSGEKRSGLALLLSESGNDDDDDERNDASGDSLAKSPRV